MSCYKRNLFQQQAGVCTDNFNLAAGYHDISGIINELKDIGSDSYSIKMAGPFQTLPLNFIKEVLHSWHNLIR